MLVFCEWVRHTWLSTVLSESTWGFPVVAALHVLALAIFGGALMLRQDGFRVVRQIGATVLILTGLLLFWIEPVRCYQSTGFWIKMLLLVVIGTAGFLPRKQPPAISLALWAGVVLASRAIAYF